MKKRRSSVKGFLFVFVILGAIAVYFFIKISKDNMTLSINTYTASGIAPDTWITLNKIKVKTDKHGEALMRLNVSKNDKLIVKVSNPVLAEELSDTIIITEDRYLAGYASIDLILKEK
jgi:hypothetical protein